MTDVVGRRRRWVGPTVGLVAAAVVVTVVVTARARPTARPAEPPQERTYVVMSPDTGRQLSGGRGSYGYLAELEVVAPDVTVVAVTPLDAAGAEVPHELATVHPEFGTAQQMLYRPPRVTEPVATTPGPLSLALVVGPRCAPTAAVATVRFRLTVAGRPAEQVVALPVRHQMDIAERVRAVCR